MRKSVSLGIVGLGGEGVVVLGTLLLRVGAREFYHGKMQKFYDARIKGGSSAVSLSFSSEKEILPSENLDILICLNGEKLKEFQAELPIVSETLFFCDDIPENRSIFDEYSFCRPFPFEKICREKGGTLQSKNMVALGILSRILGFNRERLIEEIKKFSKKYQEQNLKAFEAGLEFSETVELPSWQLVKPVSACQKIIIDGNEAMAQAALKVGCGCLVAYPITPASEIMESLGPKLLLHGKVFVQAEDEIAAAGLAIGASLGGAKSMVSTSGPGLDLLLEMLGLTCQAEIPLVVIDVQRAGPATGMPTKTEQSDLWTAIYGGHGDTPRVVLAPYDAEGCYRLTIEAFNISEHYQVPVILLSDQDLGQTSVSTDDFTQKDYEIVERLKPTEAALASLAPKGREEKENYLRYQITPNFISPFAVFGTPGNEWRGSGLAHAESGAPASESTEWQQKMAEKRWKKLLPLKERKDLVKTFGNPKSKIGIISWGSSAQITLDSLKEQGLLNKVKVCVPELLHPLPEKEIQAFLKSVKKLYVVELNYFGQFHRHLRAWIDLPKNTQVYSRAGGRPFSRTELQDWFLAALSRRASPPKGREVIK